MSIEYFDVVIVGAGLSGIGAAYHLQKKCPSKSYAILESRDSLGGTWDLFRYPGIRSDSDMHTLGYNFKPWRGTKAIADGKSILKYIRETAQENGIDKHIRYGESVKRASWSSKNAVWTIETQNSGGIEASFRCNFLLMCSGYYRYDEGYTPEFEGRDRFQGKIVHPQHWQQNLDYQDKRIIVIGSGATAVTLVPELAQDAEKVTMLQRSPSYVVSRPDEDEIANLLRKFLPEKLAYAITRWKSIALQQFFYQRSRSEPKKIKQMLISMVRQELGADYDVEKHFTPSYNPWDQRLCLVPDSDLFLAIKSGKAEVVTDRINTFTEDGILLESGTELAADIIVTATGLNLLILGGVEFFVDQKPIEFARTYTYKGVMYSDVPNLASISGYTNASWTLRADLMSEYICRLIAYMDRQGFTQCTPRLRDEDLNMTDRPYIEGFSSGYIQRVLHLLPKQGDRLPWLNLQNYQQDKKNLLKSAIEDGVLTFES
ncbi:MAG: NAD(P)/FAD-dependent oxidoreductase [Cyanobacteria bacterium P01_G01_bin.19]